MECPSTVSQKVCVEAKVTVEPKAQVGDVQACCVGKPQFEECGSKSQGCTYMVSQMVCVRFPLTISATASVKPAGIVCCQPTVKPSCHEDDSDIEETPYKEEVSCRTMERDASCFMPMSLFKPGPEEKPCVKESPCTREYYHGEKPVRRRCGLCFLPLLCLPFCRPRNKCCHTKTCRYRWPVV
jgi:hypothetical protein